MKRLVVPSLLIAFGAALAAPSAVAETAHLCASTDEVPSGAATAASVGDTVGACAFATASPCAIVVVWTHDRSTSVSVGC